MTKEIEMEEPKLIVSHDYAASEEERNRLKEFIEQNSEVEGQLHFQLKKMDGKFVYEVSIKPTDADGQ